MKTFKPNFNYMDMQYSTPCVGFARYLSQALNVPPLDSEKSYIIIELPDDVINSLSLKAINDTKHNGLAIINLKEIDADKLVEVWQWAASFNGLCNTLSFDHNLAKESIDACVTELIKKRLSSQTLMLDDRIIFFADLHHDGHGLAMGNRLSDSHPINRWLMKMAALFEGKNEIAYQPNFSDYTSD